MYDRLYAILRNINSKWHEEIMINRWNLVSRYLCPEIYKFMHHRIATLFSCRTLSNQLFMNNKELGYRPEWLLKPEEQLQQESMIKFIFCWFEISLLSKVANYENFAYQASNRIIGGRILMFKANLKIKETLFPQSSITVLTVVMDQWQFLELFRHHSSIHYSGIET